MKKKVKLITTIASLGLALALMAFGVYAATTASFKVTGTVSFTATAHVECNVSVFESANDLEEALEENAATGWNQTGTTYKISYKDQSNVSGHGADESQALTNDALTETNAVGNYYCVKVTFQNISTNEDNVLNVTWTAKTDDGATSNVVATQSADSLTVAYGETKSVVFTYKIKDALNKVENFDTGVVFTLATA